MAPYCLCPILKITNIFHFSFCWSINGSEFIHSKIRNMINCLTVDCFLRCNALRRIVSFELWKREIDTYVLIFLSFCRIRNVADVAVVVCWCDNPVWPYKYTRHKVNELMNCCEFFKKHIFIWMSRYIYMYTKAGVYCGVITAWVQIKGNEYAWRT